VGAASSAAYRSSSSRSSASSMRAATYSLTAAMSEAPDGGVGAAPGAAAGPSTDMSLGTATGSGSSGRSSARAPEAPSARMSADARATRDTSDAPPRDMAPPAPAGWSARGVECGGSVSSDKSFLRFCFGRSNKPRKIICGAQYSPGFEPGRAHRRCYNFSFSISVQSSIQSRLEHTRVPESYRKGLVAQWIRRGSTEPEIPGSIPGKINLLFF
jgi:hypothetical protein